MTTNREEEIRLTTPEDAEKYLLAAPGLRAWGSKLIFRITERVLDTHRARLRLELPKAVLRPVPDYRPYTSDRPVALEKPCRVDPSFRRLPPCKEQREDAPPGGGYTTTYVGAGVPAAEHPLAKDWFSRCMNCASTDTRIIYASSSTHYGRDGSSTWSECEYECLECGKFNYHQTHYET